MTIRFLISAAAVALALGGPARADVSPERAQAGVEAGSTLADLIADFEKTEKRLPKLSDPRAVEPLRRLFDADAILAGRPQGPNGFADLAAWNEVAGAAFRRYVAAGAGGSPEDAERNAADNQDEFALALGFLLRANGSMTQSVEARIAATPNLDASLQAGARSEMARAAAEIMRSALALSASPGVRPETARALTGAVADELPVVASVVPGETARALGALAQSAAARIEDAQAAENLRRIVWWGASAPEVAAGTGNAPVVDRASWSRALAKAIRDRVRYPEELKGENGAPPPSGRALVAMTLDRRGTLVAAEIASTSGDPRLDAAALSVVRDASPYAAPPAEIEGERVEVTAPINFVAGPADGGSAQPPAAAAPPPVAPAPAPAAAPAKPRPAQKPAEAAPKPPAPAPAANPARAADPESRPAAQPPRPAPQRPAQRPAPPPAPTTPPAPAVQPPASPPAAAQPAPAQPAPQRPRPPAQQGGRP